MMGEFFFFFGDAGYIKKISELETSEHGKRI